MIGNACLDPLPPCVADVLEEAGADDRAGNAKNLTCGVGAEQAEVPLEPARWLVRAGSQSAAQPGLVGRGHDLLQARRVGSQEIVEAAGPFGIGAGDLA